MQNELLVVAVVMSFAVIALLLARFMIPGDPTTAVLERIGQVVRQADPDLLARVSLLELQRPGSSVHRADDTEAGR